MEAVTAGGPAEPGWPDGSGPVALVGSGEYLPEMASMEAGLLQGRAGTYVQLATAAVPDGREVVGRWHRLGTEQAERLGAEPVILPVSDRRSADDPALAALVAGAGLVYLSGGSPTYLADTLRGTAVWAAILAAWRSGAALAGCSAGAMAFAASVPSLRHPRRGAVEGLGLLPRLRVIPHFDRFLARMPDVMARFLLPEDPAVTVVGVDELTALVGGPCRWTVQGQGSAWGLRREGREHWPAGTVVDIPAR